MTASNSTPKKVLVIGSIGHAGVSCVDWTPLHAIPNIADFDIVIVSSGTLLPTLRRIRTTEDQQDRQYVNYYLERVNERLLTLLKSGGTIFVILHPRDYVDDPEYGELLEVDNTDWLPFEVPLEFEEGETRRILQDRFARYFQSVKRWNYQFQTLGPEHLPDGLDQYVVDVPIAVNRAKRPIALRLSYTVPVPQFVQGNLFILPPPTEVSDDEAVRILLEDCCGIEARAAAPGWAVSLELPANRELEEQIRARRAGIENIQKELEPLLTEKQRREAFKAILYETGISPLQETVEAAFKELGFKTLPSDVSDEFYIEFKGTRALAEVKGHERSASLTDLRQLIDYQLAHEQKHGTAVKSVLVVNAWRKVPPEKRGLPSTVVFPPNVVGRAEANNIALLDTLQLFDALNAFWLEKVDTQRLFDKLLNTRGVVTLLD